MMRSYTKPDMERPIEDIRAEVKRDYEALAEMLQLPESIGFAAAVASANIGMNPRDKYPFKLFQKQFADTVARHSGNDEAFVDAFEIVTGVWNHFPHDDLGMSPVERMRLDVAAGDTAPDYDALQEEITSPVRAEKILKAIDVRLAFLSDVAHAYLERHLRSIGGTKKDARAITAIFADPKRDTNDALKYLLIDMMKARRGRNVREGVTIEDIQPTVRAITMCENHTVSVMENGHKNSRMFQWIARQCMEYMAKSLAESNAYEHTTGSVTIVEPLDALDMLLDVHAGVDVLAKRLRIDSGLTEAAHHILDWLMLTDIHDILGRDPKESAVFMLAAARLIATTGMGDKKHMFTRLVVKLQAESGFTENDFDKEVARLARKALCNCGDPVQMMPIPGREPDDCEDRLIAFAPCIKIQSPISLDDLPVPSPFM